VLVSLGVTADDVRAEVTRIVGRGEEVASGQIPFTSRAKRVLELALREALSLGHDDIGTEHVLLGLVVKARESRIGSCVTWAPTARRSARSSGCARGQRVNAAISPRSGPAV
jgi:ATP-dependent Clp protease ATP-binding subunit ClpA